ncbi:MAG: glycoside hydrolase family 3 N-terminal domain-containing protein [Candidatus Pacebacteria bacterium]|nr:glycoside hydrolase family 3 N-terminal domain-containing protein [Candidatus Paceibacterota bacterium]
MKYLILILILLLIPFFLFKEKNDQELLDKIGQMLILGFRGTEYSEDLDYLLRRIKPGGIIFFDYDVSLKTYPRNIDNLEQVKKLIKDLQQNSEIPLFITIDLEGGKVNRLQKFFSFKGHEELNNILEVQETSQSIAQKLREIGFNLNLAPVIDLNINPQNPIIGSLGRSFSKEPEQVFLLAQAFLKAHEGIITTLKHFPGHGSSLHDSHLGIVDVTDTYQDQELIPYKKLIEQGYQGMIMTAHIFNKNIDSDFPASLSSKHIKKLREMGFEGVIVSDDLHMGAIVSNYEFEKAVVLALKAGNDLLIISNNGQNYDSKAGERAKQAIFEAVKNGIILEKDIEKSYQRIMSLKSTFDKGS